MAVSLHGRLQVPTDDRDAKTQKAPDETGIDEVVSGALALVAPWR